MSFLVGSQEEDGSWPMTSRAHPGEKVFTNPVPITYFGSSWATLGLMGRSRSKGPSSYVPFFSGSVNSHRPWSSSR